MKKNDEFAIVVPVYNRASLLRRCLDSVAAQSYRPLHLIVVDNGSTDSTLSVATQWAEAHREADFRVTVVSEPKAGAAAARNRGLRETDAPWLSFFDSDDTMRPDLVDSAVQAFRSPKAPSIVTWKVAFHNPSGKIGILKFAERDFLANNIIHGTMRTQGYAVKTSLVRSAGGWNETSFIWNDWELGIRLLFSNEASVLPLGKVLADVFPQAESITGLSYKSRFPRILHTLSLAESDLSSHPEHFRLLLMVEARAAGVLRREGASAESRELLRLALSLATAPSLRFILRAVFFHTRLLGRGAALWATPLLKL